MNFRFVVDFSDIFQIPFVLLFIWSLVTICTAMLLIQMQLVEFLWLMKLDRFSIAFEIIFILTGFSSKFIATTSRFRGIAHNKFLWIVCVQSCVYNLWIWSACEQRIRWYWWYDWSIRLVFISIWNATYVANDLSGGTATS